MTVPVDAAAARGAFSRALVIMLLMAVTVVSYIDRQVLTILLEPIKRDLVLTDTQLGALTGIFFSLFYVLAGLPLARLADGTERRTMVAACVAIWSVATGFCGLAQNFIQIAIARSVVAVGEAGVVPAMSSMVADLFPPERRTGVFAGISAASAIGIAFGVFLGGTLSEHVGWRSVFLILTIPGLVLAILLLVFLPKQPRATGADRPPPMLQSLKGFWRLRSYRIALVITVLASSAAYSVLAWMATLLIRVHELPAGEVGAMMGGALVAGLLSGNIVCGLIADRLAARHRSWLLRIVGIAQALCVPFGLLSFFAESATVSVVAFGFLMFVTGFWAPPVNSLVVSVVRPQGRAVAASTLSILQAVGGAIGPLAVGMLNDGLSPSLGPDAIRYSMAWVLAASGGASIAAFVGSRFVASEFGVNERLAKAEV